MYGPDSDSEGSDPIAVEASGDPSPSQIQAGYNSFGRPSMFAQSNNYNAVNQQQGGDVGSSDDSDDDDDVVVARPVVPPRGKELRLSGKALSDADSSDEDDDNELPKASSTTATANTNPSSRGKVLRLPPKGDDSSSDDERMITKSNGSSRKRKAPTKAVDSDSDEDDDDAVAAVVVGGDVNDVMAVAEVISSNKKVKKNDGKAVKAAKKAPVKKKTSPAKKKGAKSSKTKENNNLPTVSAEKAEAAKKAHAKLRKNVTSLPFAVSENQIIRSFGKIKPEYDSKNVVETHFSSPNSIYPVGFSCDRFMFSPVHNRIITLRCDILEGKGQPKKSKVEPGLIEEDKVLSGKKSSADGPIFRIIFGEGIEQDDPMDSCPFDPNVASDYDDTLNKKTPEVGMRVNVNIDNFSTVGGVITKAKAPAKSGKNKGLSIITIKYDDGVTEDTPFPDPDIQLAPPGCPPIAATGSLTEIKGKPVQTVIGSTPLEAWGKTLSCLGLIDEIMLADALDALQVSRDEGFNEAKEKVDSLNRKRREERAKMNEGSRKSNRESPSKYRKEDETAANGAGENKAEGATCENGTEVKMEASGEPSTSKQTEASDTMKEKGDEALPKTDDQLEGSSKTDDTQLVENKKEAPSSKESELRNKMKNLATTLIEAKKRAKLASVDLANARIAIISPFAGNPFICGEDSEATETSWMASAVKKERAKMGASGKKKKIVRPTSMMERSDTFFIPKTERLVEGLPGTEYTPSYIFHSNRTASADNSWVHEAKLKYEKQRKKKEEKKRKAKRISDTKAKADKEREVKKRLKEKETATRKRQKDEEEDKKKKERVEKRMALLNAQMDEKLFKEALVTRERHIQNFVRGMNKEYNRRRKAAEIVVGNKLEHSQLCSSSDLASSLVTFRTMLPPLSRHYDEDVVRVWDFVHSFSDAFKESSALSSMPSLDVLQDAVNCLRSSGKECGKDQAEAIKLMTGIAITLCTVISPSLTRTLSSSIQNVDTIGVEGTSDGPQEEADVMYLPVTEWTWREIARMIIIWDALTDIGLSKSEASNIVKGYRSGGHPNSKEAKRWKKIEDSIIFMMYQQLSNHDSAPYRRRMVTACMSTPCAPSARPADWYFHLHNIKSRASVSPSFVKDDLEKAMASLRSSDLEDKDGFVADLEKCLAALKDAESSVQSSPVASGINKVKEMVIKILDRADEKQKHSLMKLVASDGTKLNQEPERQKMGLLNMFQVSQEKYKMSDTAKEEYMAAALRLKEKLEMKDVVADDDDDDDKSDDEEDGNTNSEEKTNKDSNSDNAKEKGAMTVESKSDLTTESMDANGHATLTEKEAEIPSEAAEGFPEGWVTRRLPRQNSNDPRCDRHWYSPKLGLKFRNKDDAKRFLNKLEDANGDESVAIVAYHGRKRAQVLPPASSAVAAAEYDFCTDVPAAPDLIRRCLAVVRTLCVSTSASPFIYPVDPQIYPAYYEAVMTPSSLYDVGKYLQDAGEKFSLNHDDPEIEDVVTEFGRKVRIIVQNSIYVNSSNSIVNAAEEMSRIFERLLFDWVLAPTSLRPNLENLDDDKCIDPHETDVSNMVLLCDACEGKYNMQRLKPPIYDVPKGDWYCPRCITGRSWTTVDPRIGREVKNDSFHGVVQSCKFIFTEGAKPSLLYTIMDINSGRKEFWCLDDVNKMLIGAPVDPIHCLESLSESPGYGFGRDSGSGVSGELPLTFNPLIADNAAQAALSSTVFKNSISACMSLANPPEELQADEWMTLLKLLVEKCASSDGVQELATEMEGKENSRQSAEMLSFWRSRGAKNIVADVSDDDSVSSEEDDTQSTSEGVGSDDKEVDKDHAIEAETDVESADVPVKSSTETAVVSKSSSEDASAEIVKPTSVLSDERPMDQDLSMIGSNESQLDGDGNKSEQQKEKEEADNLQKKRDAALVLAKTRREKKREEALVGFLVGNRLKTSAASFEEDLLSSIITNSLCNQEEGLDLQAVRCRESCHYCGLPDLALGAPLVRVPDDGEWRELFPYAVHERNTYMVASMPNKPKEATESEDSMDIDSDESQKFVSVRVRVGGELVSSKMKTADNKNYDQAMQQFLPRNTVGFQSELKFRDESNLSFLSGSLSAHEVCAAAAQKSRKDNYLRDRKDAFKDYLMKGAAMACGKSTPLGLDRWGRSYWVFSAEPKSLFVCETVPSTGESIPPTKKWHRFAQPEEIASVMIGLGKESPIEILKEMFPDAVSLVKDRSWSTLLFARRSAATEQKTGAAPSNDIEDLDGESNDNGPPFVEDEDVLVESENGSFLWEAVIVDISKDPETSKVNGYLVSYKDWNSRFDQWVTPDRVVEPSKNNTEVQEEVMREYAETCHDTPEVLKGMFAFQFCDAKKRAKGKTRNTLELFDCASVGKHGSHNEKLLGLLKGALLLIEAALPRGSVNTDEDGHWNPESAAMWRSLVKGSLGPETLMRCILVIEDAISPEWYHEQATQLYAAIPKQFRAMGEASLTAAALRISILDRCLKYQKVA